MFGNAQMYSDTEKFVNIILYLGTKQKNIKVINNCKQTHGMLSQNRSTHKILDIMVLTSHFLKVKRQFKATTAVPLWPSEDEFNNLGV